MHVNGKRWMRHESRVVVVATLIAAVLPSSARAAVTIISPSDRSVTSTPPCPDGATCFGNFRWIVDVSAPDADRVEVVYELVDGDRTETNPLCFTNIIEQRFCPPMPTRFDKRQVLPVGTWDARVRVERGGQIEESGTVRLTVAPFAGPLPGTVALQEVVPNRGNPRFQLSVGSSILASEVDIIGENLHNNPYIRAFFAPIPIGEDRLTSESALPVDDWCRTEAQIIEGEALPDGRSRLRVRVPDLPATISSRCGIQPDREADIFDREWRWAIRDTFIREDQVHRWWAVPSPRDVPWADAPPFRLGKPNYPEIDGFGFENEEDDPTYREFLTVFGNNAYICLGAFGVCASRVPDPLYLLWWPIYRKAIRSTGGSCNGMSATSLLFADEDLQTEDFDSSVYYPVGFTERDAPATYDDPSFCTPVCGPPRPENLWAHIRMNHGVQISREFLLEILDSVGEAIFDPNDLASIKGVPNATLERLRNDPTGYVLCFFQLGSGHCVTPYRVEGNRIWIYDNNDPRDSGLFIDIVDGDYDYPGRRAQGKDPNRGNAIVAFPISIWKNDRHLIGLSDFALQFGGEEFLYMIAVGDAGMAVRTDEGGRWGVQPDGSWVDALPGAVALPLLGPNDVDPSSMQFMLAMSEPDPTVEIAADGGDYGFFTGHGGVLFSLEATDVPAGDRDRLRIHRPGARLVGIDFAPAGERTEFVPKVGLELGAEESAVFQWTGLSVPATGSVGFDADRSGRAVGYRNDTGRATQHVLILEHASGPAESSGRTIYGPFDVPEGAAHRIVAADWPSVGSVRSELDLDGDGTADQIEVIEGFDVGSIVELEKETDLHIATTETPAVVVVDEAGPYRTVVGNDGPDEATNIDVVVEISDAPAVDVVETGKASCTGRAGALRCTIETLAAGEQVVLQYAATPFEPETQIHAATALGAERDPDVSNNTATVAILGPSGGEGTATGVDDAAGNGCACRSTADDPATTLILWTLVMAAAWSWPRRRRREIVKG